MNHNKIVLLVLTDGRRAELNRTILSADANLHGDIVERYMHDDTGDEAYRRQLRQAYPQFRHIGTGPRRGFGGAIAHAWAHVARNQEARYLFHLEADFTFNQKVPLNRITDLMWCRPHLAQMAFRRQAWSPEEIAAGGVVEMWPDAYVDHKALNGSRHLEHRLFYTTNPHLVHMNQVRRGWPDVPRSEAEYTQFLLRDPDVQFGYWGAREDPPWVHHIGNERVGHGY